VVQRLIKLAASDDEDVAAVACYDIGEFARFYPSGRPIVKRLGVRNIVMHLMDSPHDELRRQALLCVSKVLVQNWQHVS
jgi:V-type H+-transporting ATPase subunit H